ncbi:sigma-70 family RNA polymerase sigma factor [Sphingomonas sp. ID0503]
MTEDDFDVVPHLGSMRRYALVLTRDRHTADDLVHDTLLRAFEKADTFRTGRSLRSWLLSIVHNSFVSGLRRERAQQRRDTAFAEIQSEAVDGDQEQAVRLRELAARFAELPETQRATLHLVAVEGLSYAEAAAALEVPIGTIMSRLSRARAQLREPEETGRGKLRLVQGRDDG